MQITDDRLVAMDFIYIKITPIKQVIHCKLNKESLGLFLTYYSTVPYIHEKHTFAG